MATPRRSVFIWPSWISGLLSSDDQCRWSSHFKAHHQYKKLERDDATLITWKAEHGAMVRERAHALAVEGWTVYVEDQNKFFLAGKVATLSGCPDIVAVRNSEGLIVDCKSGQRRNKDFWQVCIYLFALPLTRHPAARVPLRGEVQYLDGVLHIGAKDYSDGVRSRIVSQIQETGWPEAPARVPSARECGFCDISECPDRVATPAQQEVLCDLF